MYIFISIANNLRNCLSCMCELSASHSCYMRIYVLLNVLEKNRNHRNKLQKPICSMCMNIGWFFSHFGCRGLCACINCFSKVLPQQACTPQLSHSWLPRLPETVIDKFECTSMCMFNNKCEFALEQRILGLLAKSVMFS